MDEVDLKCHNLFKNAPIPFEPRVGNKLDNSIKKVLDKNMIKTPIIPLQNRSKTTNLYLVGNERKVLV